LCFNWIGILSVQHNDIKAHFQSFFLFQVSSKQNLLWKGVWANVIKSIWDQRNMIVFQHGGSRRGGSLQKGLTKVLAMVEA